MDRNQTASFYQIIVTGVLDDRWKSWFNGMDIAVDTSEPDQPVTIFSGFIPDQPALRGIVIKIWDLNMELISLNKLTSYTGIGERSNENND